MPQHPLPIRLAPHHEPAVAPRSECQRLRDSDELGFQRWTGGRFAWHTPFMPLYPALGKSFRRNVPPRNRCRARVSRSHERDPDECENPPDKEADPP